jgi:hypothetical protein
MKTYVNQCEGGGTGMYNRCPSGWCDGLTYDDWLMDRTRRAKIKHGLVISHVGPGRCERHAVALAPLEGDRPSVNGRSLYGCERCGDELVAMLHSFDLEFIARRRFTAPGYKIRVFTAGAVGRAEVCANARCGISYITTITNQQYCSQCCSAQAASDRQKMRRANQKAGGVSARLSQSR